ncbi:DoxX family protein [Burkholderia sp. Bp9017]|uniref:DoxX family protein n=1 Tax=Burkholderia TaxID=32008 RepID=UPI000F5E1987|nr:MULTISPECIES: DoxX family protein [Burkholderia]RQZ25507.1 DoxX family protein [Burkholderia sp. Bp9017]RQZ33467.1 DoxX family protein [Burkholderia sp. Bp9016]
MFEAGFERYRDATILVARVAMMWLMVRFGWDKLMAVSHTVDLMAGYGLPFPALAAAVAIGAELGLGLLLMLGCGTRPLAVLMAVYTLATALTGHRYWTMTGGAQMANAIHFYKNVSIVGGVLLLAVTGAGAWSFDGWRAARRRA